MLFALISKLPTFYFVNVKGHVETDEKMKQVFTVKEETSPIITKLCVPNRQSATAVELWVFLSHTL